MSPSLLPALAANNTWLAIWPEISLGCLALLLLILEIVLPSAARRHIPTVAILGQLALLGAVLADFHDRYVGHETFNGLLRHTEGGQIMRLFFILCSTLVFWLARLTLARQTMPKIEFYNIVLVVSAAMMLLAQSNHFVMLFVALETVTIGLYILVSYTRTNALTLEAGLKYLIMGALSSALLLFGIVLLYGVGGNQALPGHTGGSMHFPELQAFLAANPHNTIAAIGVVLVLAGLAFKIGAFPFQIWIPDVYQGAPTPVTAFLAVASKAAGFAALLAVMRNVFPAYEWVTTPVLSIMAGATILFGNLAALTQHNVKRLIGLSGVSHAGFLLLGVLAVAHTPLALGAVYFYLFAYLLANFAVFGVMVHLAGPNDPEQELEHYSGLAKQDPFLGAVLAVGLGSLAGIPPLAGFVGKFLVFMAAYQAGFHGLLAIAIVGVVISIYYYFGWLRAAFFEEWRPSTELAPRPERTPVDWCSKLAAAVLALASIAVGFYPGVFGHMLHW
jgi:NADH-quinone oxidoreductase subunit N